METPVWLARSCWSRRLPTDQPSLSLPSRASFGATASVKKVSQKGEAPAMSLIGRVSMAGWRMLISRKLMPVCGLPSVLVRTRQKIHLPYWPIVVQVFWPLTMYLLPRRSARHLSEARSLPEPGSL